MPIKLNNAIYDFKNQQIVYFIYHKFSHDLENMNAKLEVSAHKSVCSAAH
jgi:hypothetical protein